MNRTEPGLNRVLPTLESACMFELEAAVGDPELSHLFELEVAVSSRRPLEALSKTASFRAGDCQSVFNVLFRFTCARPLRWRETSHALKEILRKFPESARCLECKGNVSVGEQLLWLSIDGFDRASVAGSLDPRQPNFVLAWREFHGRVSSPLMAVLANDDSESLQSRLFAAGEQSFEQSLRVLSAGSDLFETSTAESRQLSMLAVAAQLGAVRCAQILLMSGVKVGAPEVEAAFRSGNVEMMRLLLNVFPNANQLELAHAVKSWTVTGLRWLLDHKIGTLSLSDLVRLLR
jgi:hypothetical protein